MSTSSSSPQLNLVLAELYHPQIHGHTVDSSPDIMGHRLVHSTYDVDDFYHGDHEPVARMLKRSYTATLSRLAAHPTIRNYTSIVAPQGIVQFDLRLAEIVELDGGEQIAIDRTAGLIRFQRRMRVNGSRRQRLTVATTP